MIGPLADPLCLQEWPSVPGSRARCGPGAPGPGSGLSWALREVSSGAETSVRGPRRPAPGGRRVWLQLGACTVAVGAQHCSWGCSPRCSLGSGRGQRQPRGRPERPAVLLPPMSPLPAGRRESRREEGERGGVSGGVFCLCLDVEKIGNSNSQRGSEKEEGDRSTRAVGFRRTDGHTWLLPEGQTDREGAREDSRGRMCFRSRRGGGPRSVFGLCPGCLWMGTAELCVCDLCSV